MIPSQFAPAGPPSPVCKEGDFPFAAIGLDHGHIYGQCSALIEAGGTLRFVFDPDKTKIAQFAKKFPNVSVASSEAEILDNPDIKLVTAACITSQRAALGLRVMDAGKDYFVDKAPFTTLEQLDRIKKKVVETGQKYMVFYSERIAVESAVHAGDLVNDDAIGKVVQVLGLGPHLLREATRPEWFFQKEYYGGILCDIGSHQIEQFLTYGGVKDAQILSARAANFNNPNHPELDDFGETTLQGDNGCSNYFRVDWFTPAGLSTWGDGRMMILGTEGFIELRKYTDIAREATGNHLYIVNGEGEYHLDLNGKVGHPFFGKLILDCLNRTETAMTQAHAFKAGELAVMAQMKADEALLAAT